MLLILLKKKKNYNRIMVVRGMAGSDSLEKQIYREVPKSQLNRELLF